MRSSVMLLLLAVTTANAAENAAEPVRKSDPENLKSDPTAAAAHTGAVRWKYMTGAAVVVDQDRPAAVSSVDGSAPQ